MRLMSSWEYQNLSNMEKNSICNGAGAKDDWRSAFIPNTIWGLSCVEAFNIHDYDYFKGRTKLNKLKADVNMLVNLILIIIENGGWLQTPRIYRAATYFIAVHLNGADAFFLEAKGNLNLKP